MSEIRFVLLVPKNEHFMIYRDGVYINIFRSSEDAEAFATATEMEFGILPEVREVITLQMPHKEIVLSPGGTLKTHLSTMRQFLLTYKILPPESV